MTPKYYSLFIVLSIVAVLLTGMPLQAYEEQRTDNLRTVYISGEIIWIDVKQGKLQLRSDQDQNTRDVVDYRINENDTRVTDSTDMKFLTIDDLQPGQHVTMQVNFAQDDKVVTKITADPDTASHFQVATGELEYMDVPAGMFIIDGKPLSGETGRSNLTYFVFDSDRIVMMEKTSNNPANIRLIPGDMLKVEFVVRGGARHAKSITLLSRAPDTSSTTTTTTTSTTVRQ